jgi:hypothetical protein
MIIVEQPPSAPNFRSLTCMDGAQQSPGIRFGTRSLFLGLFVLAVLFAAYGWLYRRIIEPRRHSDSVERRIESLALRRPPEMSPRQWESAVAWTRNLHGNSLLMFQADGPTIREFDQPPGGEAQGGGDHGNH